VRHLQQALAYFRCYLLDRVILILKDEFDCLGETTKRSDSNHF
jgi:hypothetical protein